MEQESWQEGARQAPSHGVHLSAAYSVQLPLTTLEVSGLFHKRRCGADPGDTGGGGAGDSHTRTSPKSTHLAPHGRAVSSPGPVWPPSTWPWLFPDHPGFVSKEREMTSACLFIPCLGTLSPRAGLTYEGGPGASH